MPLSRNWNRARNAANEPDVRTIQTPEAWCSSRYALWCGRGAPRWRDEPSSPSWASARALNAKNRARGAKCHVILVGDGKPMVMTSQCAGWYIHNTTLIHLSPFFAKPIPRVVGLFHPYRQLRIDHHGLIYQRCAHLSLSATVARSTDATRAPQPTPTPTWATATSATCPRRKPRPRTGPRTLRTRRASRAATTTWIRRTKGAVAAFLRC